MEQNQEIIDWAEKKLAKYTQQFNIPARNLNDLSPLEKWLLSQLHNEEDLRKRAIQLFREVKK